MADNKVKFKTIKNEDVEKYVALAKDIVQIAANLAPEDSVAKKVVQVVDALLAKGCVVETVVFAYNVVVNFGNKDEFDNLVGTHGNSAVTSSGNAEADNGGNPMPLVALPVVN